MTYDLLIKNGHVVDGSGEPAFQADVAVHQGKIVGVGKSNGAAAKRTIDAAGRGVPPGLFDHPTHFDPQAGWGPHFGPWGAARPTPHVRRPRRARGAPRLA